MKIFCTEVLNKKFKLSCIKHKPDLVIYARVSLDLDLTDFTKKFKVEHAYSDNNKLLWYTYNSITCRIQSIIDKLGNSVFNYHQIDIKDAVIKDLYWSLLDEFAIDFCIQKYNTTKNTIIKYSNNSKIKTLLSIVNKVLFGKTNFSYVVFKNESVNNNLIFFRIHLLATIEIYGDLFTHFLKNQIASYQTVNSTKALIAKCNNFFSINISAQNIAKRKKSISFFQLLKIVRVEKNLKFINALLNSIVKQKSFVENYENLYNSGINKIVLNAGENEAEGLIASLVAKKYNAKVYNYMNGYKSKDPHNIKTEFYCWFMPDIATKELIESYCEVDKTKLPIVGHLILEQALSHKYSGTLDFIKEKLQNKLVISFFSSKVFDDEKKAVLSFLNDFTKKHDSVIVLIRKHPAEKNSFIFENENIIVLPTNPPELSQISLYDLFLNSNFAISFSSTISLQANWFSVPSVNFDFSKETRLTYIDNDNIFHISEIENLERLINEFVIYKSRSIVRKNNQNCNTSKSIKEYLLNE